MLKQLKEQFMAVLNGSSIGVIVSLIPSALLSQILLALPKTEVLTIVNTMIVVAQCSLPFLAAFFAGSMLNMSLLQCGSVALATFIAAGNMNIITGSPEIHGSGAILNIILTCFISIIIAQAGDKYFGQLKMIIEPIVVLLIGGGIGLFTLPYMIAVQNYLGYLVAGATSFTPLVMGAVMGLAFAFIIVSPVSSVGIALAISITGIASGSANAGITAASFALAYMGAKVNDFGGTIAHFVGSPKIQMANIVAKPKIYIPIFVAAAVAGFFSAVLNLQGTPFSAGFGFSGLIGPLTAFQVSGGSMLGLRVLLGFVVIPVIMAWLVNFIFVKKIKLIKPDDLKLPKL